MSWKPRPHLQNIPKESFALLVLIVLGIINVYKENNKIPNRNNLRRHKKSKKNLSTRTKEKRDKEVEIETEKLKGN